MLISLAAPGQRLSDNLFRSQVICTCNRYIALFRLSIRFLLGLVSGMNEAGLFEYSDKVARMPLAVVTALGTVMLPHMTESMSCSNNGKESESSSPELF